jgi:hypothetical protein
MTASTLSVCLTCITVGVILLVPVISALASWRSSDPADDLTLRLRGLCRWTLQTARRAWRREDETRDHEQ